MAINKSYYKKEKNCITGLETRNNRIRAKKVIRKENIISVIRRILF